MTQSYPQWFAELCAIIDTEFPGYSKDEWYDFYEDGYSPREALAEDMRE